MKILNHIKTNWKNYLIILLLIFVLVGTTSNNNFTKSLNMAESSLSNYQKSLSYDRISGSDNYEETENRKIIKNANMNLETNQFDKTKNAIENLLNKYNAITLSKNQYKYDKNYNRINYRFKVNSENLETVVDSLKGYGDVQNIKIYSNDVTKTYNDYSNRILRYENQITKYKQMLEKTNIEVEDEIKIQERIDNIEDDLFYLYQRTNDINSDVKYSTLDLTLIEEQSALDEIDFLELKDGIKMFLESFQTAIKFLIVIIGFIIPFIVIFGIYHFSRKIIHKF